MKISKILAVLMVMVLAVSILSVSASADNDLPLSGKKAPAGSVLLTKEYHWEFGKVNQTPKFSTGYTVDKLFDQIAPEEGGHFWVNANQANQTYGVIGHVVFDEPMVLTEIRVQYAVWPDGLTMPNTGNDAASVPDLLGMRTYQVWATVEPGDSNCLKYISAAYTDEANPWGAWMFNEGGANAVPEAEDKDGDGWVIIPITENNVGTGFYLRFDAHADLTWGGSAFISEIEYYGYPQAQGPFQVEEENEPSTETGDCFSAAALVGLIGLGVAVFCKKRWY